AAHTVRCTY
ncbi:hypothetical protein CISIN_1g0280011mg, partial [Citrus sinensis]